MLPNKSYTRIPLVNLNLFVFQVVRIELKKGILEEGCLFIRQNTKYILHELWI